MIETEQPPRSIKQWYERVVNLNRHWREKYIKRKVVMRKEKIGAFNTKTKYRDTMEIDATASNLAKKTR